MAALLSSFVESAVPPKRPCTMPRCLTSSKPLARTRRLVRAIACAKSRSLRLRDLVSLAPTRGSAISHGVSAGACSTVFSMALAKPRTNCLYNQRNSFDVVTIKISSNTPTESCNENCLPTLLVRSLQSHNSLTPSNLASCHWNCNCS